MTVLARSNEARHRFKSSRWSCTTACASLCFPLSLCSCLSPHLLPCVAALRAALFLPKAALTNQQQQQLSICYRRHRTPADRMALFQSLSRTLPRALSSALTTKASSFSPLCSRSLASAAALDQAALLEGSTPLVELRRQLDTRDGTLLPNSLPYFHNKKAAASKRPACLTRDLVVLEYHCANQLFPSYTTGWLLDTPSKQPILVTCCHTLQEVRTHLSPSSVFSPEVGAGSS